MKGGGFFLHYRDLACGVGDGGSEPFSWSLCERLNYEGLTIISGEKYWLAGNKCQNKILFPDTLSFSLNMVFI